MKAPLAAGWFTTTPFPFNGKKRESNFATSAAPQMRVELQDAAGKPIPGYSCVARRCGFHLIN